MGCGFLLKTEKDPGNQGFLWVGADAPVHRRDQIILPRSHPGSEVGRSCFSSATFRTWRPTEDSCWEGYRGDPVCTGSIWEEARDHKQEGVLQETGLQTRVGREGW